MTTPLSTTILFFLVLAVFAACALLQRLKKDYLRGRNYSDMKTMVMRIRLGHQRVVFSWQKQVREMVSKEPEVIWKPASWN